MAYVTGFEQDVFISYTHDDNQPFGIDQEGWVTLFERALTGLLRQRLPKKREVEVWRDPKLHSNDLLDETLDATVSRAAVLICVVSARYLDAPWCHRELSAFWQSRHQGFEPKFRDKLRVFKVLVQDPEAVREVEAALEGYPPEMRRTVGVSFFDGQPPAGFTHLAWPTALGDKDRRFMVNMEGLANEIAAILEAMRKVVDLRDETFDDAGAGQKSLGTIYLAEVSDDLVDESYKLRQELQRIGLRVLPEDFLSNKRAEAEAEIRAALSESQFAVHLFADKYGKPLRDDKECSLPHLQYLLTREHAAAQKTPFDRLVWIADAVDRSSLPEPQKRLLEQVENEPDGTAPVDIQTGSLQRFKESIVKRVSKPVRPKAPPVKRNLIYVTGQASDLKTKDATTLIDYLGRAHDVFGAPVVDDDEHRRKQYQKYCQLSDGILLLYGEAPSDWVQDKVLDVRELSRARREKPLTAAVYEAPPPDRDELQIRFEDVLLVDGRKGFDPQKLVPFLERVGERCEAL